MNQTHYTFKTKFGTKHSGWYNNWAEVLEEYPGATLIHQMS